MSPLRLLAGSGVVALLLLAQACSSIPSPEALHREGTEYISNIEELEERYDSARARRADLKGSIESERAARREIVRRLDSISSRANALKVDIDRLEDQLSEQRREPGGLTSPGPGDSRRLFLKGDELYHRGELELARQYLTECYRKDHRAYDYDLHALFRLGQISRRLGRSDHLAWVFLELQNHQSRFSSDSGRVQVYRGFGSALPPGTIEQLKALDLRLRGLRDQWSGLRARHGRVRRREYEPINASLDRSIGEANRLADSMRSATTSLKHKAERLRALLDRLDGIIQDLDPDERAPYERVAEELRARGARSRHFPQT